MKIDIFTHVTPEKYWAALGKKYSALGKSGGLMNMEAMFRTMERHPDVLKVISTGAIPPVEELMTPADSVEFSRLCNDETAELLHKYPDKFVGAVATLPLKDMDAALEETDRAINDLGFKGVQVVATLFGEPLGHPKYRPLYEKMVEYDMPIWIHPCDSIKSTNNGLPIPIEASAYGLLAWPVATAFNMMNLVTEGILNDYPDIKFITHHCGGVLPYIAGRIRWLYGFRAGKSVVKLKEQFRKFYNDTASMGDTATLMCGYDFFGADRLLFGTDGLTQETINSVNRMNIPEADKEKIFYQNAINLLNLRV